MKILLIMLILLLNSLFSVNAIATEKEMQLVDKSADTTEGEIRKIDKENKKITIKHGEMKNLEMPGMTMVFQVKDPDMLDKVKVGDKVKFRAEKKGGAFVVISLEVL